MNRRFITSARSWMETVAAFRTCKSWFVVMLWSVIHQWSCDHCLAGVKHHMTLRLVAKISVVESMEESWGGGTASR